jgi:hypothetical protein
MNHAKVKKWIPLLAGFVIFGYFLYFAAGALEARFAADDMENLYRYWRRGFLWTLWDNVHFWSKAYRPMGGLFYLPLFYGFRLNPLPYRIVVLLLLAANIWLSYRVADLMTKSKSGAALTAVLVCAHAGMVALYYNDSQIYDVLAYFFTLLMLLLYLRIRCRGQTLNLHQSAMVLCAYIAALNSKEIAVVGAAWIFGYEILFQRRRMLGLPAILVGAGLVYTLGKLHGPGSMAQQPGYALDVSFHRYLVNNLRYVNDLLYTSFFDSGVKLAAAWCLLTVLGFELRKPQFWWCWFVVSTATLPTSFVAFGRGASGLYLPLFGFALLIANLMVLLLHRPALRRTAALVLALGFAYQTVVYWRERAPAFVEYQRETWSVIDQLRDLEPHPAPNSRVIFMDNPFPQYDVVFIASLVWNDPTIRIELANWMPARPAGLELDRFDWILTFKDHKLQVLRSR